MMRKNIYVRAGADFSAITKQARKASAGMQGMANAAQKAAGMMKSAFAAIGALVSIRAIVGAAKDAAEAYDQQAEAEAKLAQAMRNTMGASAEEIRSIKDLTAAQQALGVVGDEVQLAGAQQLAGYLSQTSSLQKLIPAMNDMVAQQYGYSASAENAASVATTMGKVLNGQTGALTRNGYSFTDAQERILKYGTEEQRVATLSEIVEQRVGGMNAALAQTPTGRMKQLSNTLGDIKEQFGKAVRTLGTAFLPILNRVAGILADVATLANKVAQAIANVLGGNTSGMKSYAYGAAEGADAYEDLADSYGDTADQAKKAAKAQQQAKNALSSADIDILHTLKDNSKDSSSGGDDSGDTSPSSGAVPSGIQEMPDEAQETVGWLEQLLQKFKDLFSELDFGPLKKAWEGLKAALEPLVNLIKQGLAWCWENVLKPLAHWTIEKLAPELINLLAAAFRLLTAVLEALKPIFSWLWENILKPLAQWTGEIFIFALQQITDLLNDLADLINGKISFREFVSQLDLFQKGLLAVAGTLAAIKISSWVAAGIAALAKLKASIEAVLATIMGTKTAAAGAGAAVSTDLVPAANSGASAISSFAMQGLLGAGAMISVKETIDDVLDPIHDYDDAIYSSSTSSDELRQIVEELDAQLTQQQQEFDNSTILGRAFNDMGGQILKTQTKLSEATDAYYSALRREGKEIDDNTRLQLNNSYTVNEAAYNFKTLGERASEAGALVKEKWNAVQDSLRRNGETIKTSLSDTWEKIKQKAAQGAQDLQNNWANIKSSAVSAGEAINNKFSSALNAVKTAGSSAFNSVKSAWNSAGSWAKNTGDAIANSFASGLQALVQKVQQIASQVKQIIESIKSTISGAMSSVGSSLNSLRSSASSIIGGITSSISSAFSSITTRSYSFNFPHLAAGAVIPPNREFAAILGDQANGTNIETPEGLLRQIFREEAAYSSSDVVDLMKDILRAVRSGQRLEVDRHTLGRVIRQAEGY